MRAVNQGGEVHTFTEVAEFGGGIIPGLNDPPKLAAVPECAGGYTNISVASTRIIQGSSVLVTDLHKGVHRFECCIYPWNGARDWSAVDLRGATADRVCPPDKRLATRAAVMRRQCADLCRAPQVAPHDSFSILRP